MCGFGLAASSLFLKWSLTLLVTLAGFVSNKKRPISQIGAFTLFAVVAAASRKFFLMNLFIFEKIQTGAVFGVPYMIYVPKGLYL